MDCLKKYQMSEEFNKTTKEDKIKTAERELAEFLEKHPEYKAYQEKINKTLAATPEEKRLEVLGLMMAGKMAKLVSVFVELDKIAKEVDSCSRNQIGET